MSVFHDSLDTNEPMEPIHRHLGEDPGADAGELADDILDWIGSIDPADFSVSKGPCLKCGACVKQCPRKARYFDHEIYLEHTAQLEEEYARRGEVSLF